MALVRHTTGGALTPEKQAGMKAEIDAATKRPYAYDPDAPLLTEKQLSELRPVNFTTMEERHGQWNKSPPLWLYPSSISTSNSAIWAPNFKWITRTLEGEISAHQYDYQHYGYVGMVGKWGILYVAR